MSIHMDATTRWETEAIRASSSQRSGPPRPSAKRSDDTDEQPRPIRSDARWVTLKEAEAATGIPSNTIRKWVRKDTVDSYLESDGQLALRMVDLDSLLARAKALGRTVTEQPPAPVPLSRGTAEERRDDAGGSEEQSGDDPAKEDEPTPPPSQPEGTMLVPIDAWNKMLSQLGNLHEAGQQLAEARERAAKAETESRFLRERLAEMREEQKTSDDRPQTTDPEADSPSAPLSRGTAEEQSDDAGGSSGTTADPEADTSSVPLSRGTGERSEPRGSREQSDRRGKAEERSEDAGGSAEPPETTTYWRYLTTGWRDRKRRFRR